MDDADVGDVRLDICLGIAAAIEPMGCAEVGDEDEEKICGVRVSNEGLWMRLRLGNTTSCCGTQ